MLNAKRFEMSQGTREEYLALPDEDWEDLISVCMKQIPTNIKQKDIIILRLYLTFMGKDQAKESNDAAFLGLFG